MSSLSAHIRHVYNARARNEINGSTDTVVSRRIHDWNDRKILRMEKHADSAGVHFYAQENFFIGRPKVMLEKEIERKLKKRVEELGCLCLKFESPGFTGVPDRIILMPGGEMFFVETKAPGQKERPRQEYVQDQFRRLGFIVISSVNNEAGINQVCALCESWMQRGIM